jgi:hypothetical protein
MDGLKITIAEKRIIAVITKLRVFIVSPSFKKLEMDYSKSISFKYLIGKIWNMKTFALLKTKTINQLPRARRCRPKRTSLVPARG